MQTNKSDYRSLQKHAGSGTGNTEVYWAVQPKWQHQIRTKLLREFIAQHFERVEIAGNGNCMYGSLIASYGLDCDQTELRTQIHSFADQNKAGLLSISRTGTDIRLISGQSANPRLVGKPNDTAVLLPDAQLRGQRVQRHEEKHALPCDRQSQLGSRAFDKPTYTIVNNTRAANQQQPLLCAVATALCDHFATEQSLESISLCYKPLFVSCADEKLFLNPQSAARLDASADQLKGIERR